MDKTLKASIHELVKYANGDDSGIEIEKVSIPNSRKHLVK